MRDRLRLAIPNKGRLVEPSLALLHDAGLVFEEHDRSLVARVQNFPLDILFVRTNDVIEFVGDGVADLGVTGVDLLTETGAELPKIRELGYVHAFALGGRVPPLVVEETAFAVRVEGEPRLSDEHDEHRWCTPQEALRLLPFAGLRRAVRLLTGA